MKLPAKYSTLDWRKGEKAIVRAEYIRLQENKCFYCGHSLDDEPPIEITSKPINWKLFPPNFRNYSIHLQHCHKTDMTEGAVHAYCNAVLWQYHGR